MFYPEKTILYTKFRYTEDCIFCSLPHIYKIWSNILGNSTIMHKVHLIQKRKISITLVIRYKELMYKLVHETWLSNTLPASKLQPQKAKLIFKSALSKPRVILWRSFYQMIEMLSSHLNNWIIHCPWWLAVSLFLCL